MSEKPTDRVDWALGEARRMVSERPHSPNARAAAVLADEVCRLREERDSQDWYTEWYAPMKRRAEAAEAEKVRLTEGLRDLLTGGNVTFIMEKARALLADSPPDGPPPPPPPPLDIEPATEFSAPKRDPGRKWLAKKPKHGGGAK